MFSHYVQRLKRRDLRHNIQNIQTSNEHDASKECISFEALSSRYLLQQCFEQLALPLLSCEDEHFRERKAVGIGEGKFVRSLTSIVWCKNDDDAMRSPEM